ncbi:MAG: threonine ammonia-lyase [Anaerolineales bacterium]
MMIPQIWFEQASQRIAEHITKSPLQYDQGNDLLLKWENLQRTGSFKIRGAINRILTLEPWERETGIVTASAGNHGLGLALAGRLVNAAITVFVSESASPIKIEAMRKYGAEIIFVPGGYGEAEQAALEFSRQNSKTWVSAYNDGQVIAGQGTLALEVLSEIEDNRHLTWIVPCGGGGLLSGIASVVKMDKRAQGHHVVGVQSVASPYMYELYRHKSQEDVREQPSLADGLAGPVEQNSLTIPIIRSYVDDMILVTEEDILNAMAVAWKRYGQRIEPSAAVSMAAVLTGKVAERPVLTVITGGNIQVDQHEELIQAVEPL